MLCSIIMTYFYGNYRLPFRVTTNCAYLIIRKSAVDCGVPKCLVNATLSFPVKTFKCPYVYLWCVGTLTYIAAARTGNNNPVIH